MNETLFYLTKVLTGSCIMYLGYLFLLRKNTQFKLVRWYLLAGLALPWIVPFIELPNAMQQQGLPVITIPLNVNISAHSIENQETNSLFDQNWMYWGYTGIAAFLFMLVMYRFGRVIQLIFASQSFKITGIRFHITHLKLTPFSIFNNILLPTGYLHRGCLKPIIHHELAHIKQGHTYDNLFTEFICILAWFNPFVWLLRKAIHENHEYLADSEAVKDKSNLANYNALLFESLTGIRMPVVNNFNQSSIKNRLIMLNNFKNRQKSINKTIAIIMLLFAGVLSSSILIQKESYAATLSSMLPTFQDGKTQTPPEYATGHEGMMKFLISNIKYPETARKEGITGTTYISFNVKEDGSLADFSVKKGFNAACDAEALRVVKLMPKWKPGTKNGKPILQEMTLPIKFALDGDGKKKYVSDVKTKDPKPSKQNEGDVFTVVEDMPEFVGGPEAMAKYLAAAVKYPEEARKAGLEGTVYVTFVVEETGKVSDVKILRGFDKACDETALNAVKSMPNWKPGTQKGQAVKVQFNVPVRFKLDKDSKETKK
jgi:TonB family protein